MLEIGKIRGALYSGVIIWFYYWYWLPMLHHSLFGFAAQEGWGTNLVLTGLFMTQVVIIQSGDRAQLTFAIGLLNRTWRNGPALMPNILHSTIVMFRFALLWGLVVLKNDTFRRYKDPDVRIDTNDLNFKYNINVTMTHSQARRSQAIDFLWKAFWDYKRVPEEYYVASAGYRVLLVGVMIVCVNSTAILAKQKAYEAVRSISTSITTTVQQPRK